MNTARVTIVVVLALAGVGGCTPPRKPPVVVENVLPTDYKNQLATYLGTVLIDRTDFRNSFIAPPVLMQVGDAQHYVVCVQLNGHNQHKDKVAIYLGTTINQFVDATPGQCASAAYEPFKELAGLLPPT